MTSLLNSLLALNLQDIDLDEANGDVQKEFKIIVVSLTAKMILTNFQNDCDILKAKLFTFKGPFYMLFDMHSSLVFLNKCIYNS